MKLITVLTFNADGECTSACTKMDDDKTEEEVIEAMKDESFQNFNGEFYDACGQIVYRSKVAPPKLPCAIVDVPVVIETVDFSVEE